MQLAREQVEIVAELKSSTKEIIGKSIATKVAKDKAIKSSSVQFISKAEGANIMREEFGEDFILLDMPNPLYHVISFNVNADYLEADSLAALKKRIQQQHEAVSDVFYQEGIASDIANNIKNLSFIALGLGIFLLFIAFVLIHNTIRLALYANRFLIKNMELAGASHGFISRPYILRSIGHGLLSGLIATAALSLVLIGFYSLLPELSQLLSPFSLLLLALLIIGTGVLISMLSTVFVVNKYLTMRIDELY